MTTRREMLGLIAAVPWFGGSALAAERISVDDFLKQAVERLSNPGYVMQQYAALRFYIELLRSYPPEKKDKYKYDPKAIEVTATLLSRAIFAERKVFKPVAPDIIKEWQSEFRERQNLLQQYLKQVGIEAASPADRLIENSLFSLVLYDVSVTETKKLAELRWCIWPFCYSSPA